MVMPVYLCTGAYSGIQDAANAAHPGRRAPWSVENAVRVNTRR